MADDEPVEEEEAKSGGMMGKLLVWGIVFVLGLGTGAAVPLFLMPPNATAANSGQEAPDRMDIPEPNEKLAFIEFDEVVVNLDDTRFSRYVTCNFSIQIAESQKLAIETLMDERKAVLTNWLIAHLRDKKLEDVRGKLGHNTLRREIHGKFNELMFTDGVERIQDVLFQDFKVQ